MLAVAFGRQQQLASAAAGEEVPGSEANLELHGAKGSSAGAADTPSRARKGAVSAEDVVLVLDCGGGTVDLTLARVYGTGRRTRLEEEAVGRGGQGPRGCLGVWLGVLAPCPSALIITHVLLPSFAPRPGVLAGSRFVDAEAFALLRTLVGEEPWDEWRRRQPDEWVQLEERWVVPHMQSRPLGQADVVHGCCRAREGCRFCHLTSDPVMAATTLCPLQRAGGRQRSARSRAATAKRCSWCCHRASPKRSNKGSRRYIASSGLR